MRTTLNIDDEVLLAARSIARRRGVSVGKALSQLAREALKPATDGRNTRNGVPLLRVPARPTPVTLDLVNQLREEDQ